MQENNREQLRKTYQTSNDLEKTFIPAKPKINPNEDGRHFRVCAYCRVSTDNDEQLSSFELQQAHYRQVAEQHPNWDLSRIYADEGISGTSLKNRDQFNEMISACKMGHFDLIVTKSVSRFARNLVDCISLIRMLKGLNPPVGVFFETDNVYTLSENSEFMLSFLATFAQEESVKKSEAMMWSLTQRFKDGKLLTPALLGYDRPKDVTGRYIKYAALEINESEANIVRFIYDAYLYGWSMDKIASFLTDIGCETKTGNTEWNSGSISYILSNERYCGDVLTWKTFTADLFEHKHKKNNQDKDQYLYRDHHDAIISVERFEAVQTLLQNRRHHMRGTLPLLQVIDNGVFKGFVPINHHWVNDDPSIYYDISNSVKRNAIIPCRLSKKMFSFFDLGGYQVVRSQFTTLRYEGPALTISDDKIMFNRFCMKRYSEVSYVQLLLHPTERKIALRPCNEHDIHNIRWRPDPEKPLYSKTISCPHFGVALYSIMDWNPEYMYKVRGIWAQNRGDQIIVFNLENAVPTTYISDENNRYKKRVELCPEEWEDNFGEEFYEHKIENDIYYLSQNADWISKAVSIPAPGIKQYDVPTYSDVLDRMETIKGGEILSHGGE